MLYWRGRVQSSKHGRHQTAHLEKKEATKHEKGFDLTCAYIGKLNF